MNELVNEKIKDLHDVDKLTNKKPKGSERVNALIDQKLESLKNIISVLDKYLEGVKEFNKSMNEELAVLGKESDESIKELAEVSGVVTEMLKSFKGESERLASRLKVLNEEGQYLEGVKEFNKSMNEELAVLGKESDESIKELAEVSGVVTEMLKSFKGESERLASRLKVLNEEGQLLGKKSFTRKLGELFNGEPYSKLDNISFLLTKDLEESSKINEYFAKNLFPKTLIILRKISKSLQIKAEQLKEKSSLVSANTSTLVSNSVTMSEADDGELENVQEETGESLVPGPALIQNPSVDALGEKIRSDLKKRV